MSIEVTGTAIVTRKGLRRARRGVPHLEAEDVVRYDGDGGPFVDLVDETSLPMGTAVFDPSGRPRVRLLSSARTRDPIALLRTRLERAFARRHADLDGAESGRMVHAEADGIPGVLVDRFGPGLLVTVESEPMRRVVDEILPALAEQAKADVVVVSDRDGARIVRAPATGSDARVRYPHGRLELEIDLAAPNARDLTADLERQRALRRWARGRVVDICAGHGGYGLQLAEAGASEVVCVDQPPWLSPSLLADAERSSLRAPVQRVEQDGVAWLKQRESDRQQFDVVVFHPRPTEAADFDAALRTVFEHADLCARLLGEGGILAASSSCAGVDDGQFMETLQDAAARTRKRLQILARLGPGPDHPVLAGTPSPPSLVVARVLQSA